MRKTEHYQLNLWDADDAIQRVDFNADNEKLDAVLAEIAAGGVKMASGHYTGNGAFPAQLDVGFDPKFLVVFGPDPDYRMFYVEGMTSVYTYVKRNATTAYNYAVTVSNGTLSWGTNSERAYFLNAEGTKYFWFAVG